MEIQVSIAQVLENQVFPKRDGSGNIVKGGFVGDTMSRYPQKIKFDIFGEERIDAILPSLAVGAVVNVSFDPQSREWQGRWYTELQAWKVEPAVQAPRQVQQQHVVQPQPVSQQMQYQHPQQPQYGAHPINPNEPVPF